MSNSHEIDWLTPARLRTVLAVASAGSFSAAAVELGSSQSNVSRAVAAVEQALGATIFDRSTRSTRPVRLTDVGREFVERAALVNAELEAAIGALRPELRPTPRLAIAALTSVSELHLADALSALSGPVGRFRCVEGLQATVEQAVLSGQVSAGIGDLSGVTAELAVRPMWTEPFRVALSRGHRLSRRRKVSLDDLAAEPLIGFSRDAELRTTLDRELATARQLRAPDYIVDRYRTALSFVAAGMGVMVVPAIVAEAVPAGAKLVDLDTPGLQRTMGLLQRQDSVSSPELDALLDQLVGVVGNCRGVMTLR